VQITITEIAPRDGWQNVNEYIPLETKLDLIDRMFAAGIQRMQAGSFVSPKAIPQMKDAKELFASVLARYPERSIFALVPNLQGARAAVECGLKEITNVISVSESHNKNNTNRTVAESMAQLAEIRETFPNLALGLDVATAFGCPFEGETSLEALMGYLAQASKVKLDSITLCDTVGVAYPAQVKRFVEAVRRELPQVSLEIHIHDTRNLGMLNTWTAVECGVTHVQTSLGGLGGCPFAPGASGNTATEDFVYLLDKEGISTGIDFDKLLAAAVQMHSVVNGNYSGHQLTITNTVC